MFDINGWEFVIIAVIAAVIIGPERLPEYAARLRGWVRDLRSMAEGAKEQLREQMGPEFDDVDWKAYDPRQYDPRRIVREALLEDPTPASPGQSAGSHPAASAGTTGATAYVPPPAPAPAVYDPAKATPYDIDAT